MLRGKKSKCNPSYAGSYSENTSMPKADLCCFNHNEGGTRPRESSTVCARVFVCVRPRLLQGLVSARQNDALRAQSVYYDV